MENQEIVIFKCNAACGYNEFVYLLPINNEEFLCIHKNIPDNSYFSDMYKVGEIVKDIEHFYLEKLTKIETQQILEDKTLEFTQSYLFKYFLENFKDVQKHLCENLLKNF